MASLMRGLMTHAARYDLSWRLLDKTVVRWSQHAQQERRRRAGNPLTPLEREAIQVIAPDLTVKHGVFAGLKYGDMQSVGSALAPKLLGSYEREIQPLLERLCAARYSDVVNVGCAEGYYAVGLARRMPGALVRAYDTNDAARRLCEQMAALNNVRQRIEVGAFCSSETLSNIPFRGKALVVADCEGYEKDLFTDKTVAALAAHDVLVEVHDFVDIEISSILRRRFAGSHDLKVFQSIDDIQKAKTYDYPELAPFDLAARKLLLAERRPAIMEWFFFQSRQR